MHQYHKKLHHIHHRLKKRHVPATLLFIVMGVISTAWFLIRVFPKPQRAGYPCMQAAFPIMTGFLIWVGSVTGAFVTFRLLSGFSYSQTVFNWQDDLLILDNGAPDLFIDCTFEIVGKLQLIDYATVKHAEGDWRSKALLTYLGLQINSPTFVRMISRKTVVYGKNYIKHT